MTPVLNMRRTVTVDHELHGQQTPRRRRGAPVVRGGEPRPERVRRPRRARRRPGAQPARRVRVRHPLLPRRARRAARDPGDVRGDAAADPALGARRPRRAEDHARLVRAARTTGSPSASPRADARRRHREQADVVARDATPRRGGRARRRPRSRRVRPQRRRRCCSPSPGATATATTARTSSSGSARPSRACSRRTTCSVSSRSCARWSPHPSGRRTRGGTRAPATCSTATST